MPSAYHSDGQGSPDSMSADLQAALSTVSYPANKDQAIAAARLSGVSNEILTALDGLPERDYANADAILHALG